MNWNGMNKRRKGRSRRSGSTMVEVVVSFVILLIACGMFSRCIVFSSGLQKKSRQLRTYAAAVQEQILANSSPDTDAQDKTLSFAQSGGSNRFDVNVNLEKRIYRAGEEEADVYCYSNPEETP